MEPIPNIIHWAKKCQYLSRGDILTTAYFNGGKVDERHPELLRMERMTLEYLYHQNPSDSRLTLIGNYVLSLCGKYLGQAKSQYNFLASSDTAYYNANLSGEYPSEMDILSWPLRSKILADGSVLADFSTFNASPMFLFVAIPKTEQTKIRYFFSDDNKGSIGTDSAWGVPVEVGQFSVYRTNYETQTGFAIMQLQD